MMPKVGDYLETNYLGITKDVESSLCHCQKERMKWVASHRRLPFPGCAVNLWDDEGDGINHYWTGVVERLKMDKPEIIMEMYLLGILY